MAEATAHVRIQCENCGTQHELDPPSWVVSSGRSFRFRCSACGHSQSVHPSAIPEAGEELEVDPHTMEEPEAPKVPAPPTPDVVAGDPPAGDEGVFLKQNGQIYMVRDWETLKRWIQERRVDRHDLVSEGGVRWEPVGSRADLMAAFSSGLPDLPTTEPTPFPFGTSETPFGTGSSPNMGWHDDDTEGVPTGLPPLPTEEVHERTPSVAPPALLDDDDETPDPAPPRRSAANPTPTPSIAPPALEDDDDEPAPVPTPDERDIADLDVEDLSEDSDRGRPPEAVVTAPGSVMRLKDPPKLPMPVPSSPATTESGSWDDLMITEPTVSRTASPQPEAVAAVVQEVDFDDEWAHAQRSPPSNQGVLYLAAAAAVLFVSVPLLWYAFGGSGQADAGARPPALEPLPVAAPAVPAPVEPAPVVPSPVAPVPVAPSEPAPQPVAPPAPVAPQPVAPSPVAPAPQPAAPRPAAPQPTAPQPAAPKATSTRAQLDAGWKIADTDPKAAAAHFQAVLAGSPANAEAHYGHGYVLLKMNRQEEGRRALCAARSSQPATDILQEVNGMLAARQLGCD